MDKPPHPHEWGLFTPANSSVGSQLNRHTPSNVEGPQGKLLRSFGYPRVGTSASFGLLSGPMSNICQWMLGQKLQGTSLVLQFNGDGLLVPAGLGST